MELSFSALEDIKPRFKSKWSSYVRIIARLQKIALRPGNGIPRRNFITPKDIETAERLLFRKIQFDCFPDEVTALMAHKTVHRSSKILSLSPCMKEDKVMRLSSRAQLANTSYAARNHAVLPNKHELVDLLIQHLHEANFHIGEDTTIADIREHAWIVHIRAALARVKHNCAHCKLHSAKPKMPLMGQLPLARLDFSSKPFTHVGVDCFGPYEVKFGRGRIKR